MKTKMVKKLFAVVLSAAMVMGMSATVMAADTTTGEAPIYSFDVENVIVPTTFVTAFNPDGLIVKKSDGTTSTAPIQSMNYGILNKSSKDKIVTVDLTITDKNATGTNPGVTFVDTASDATSADKNTYAIHMMAIPAKDDKEVVTTPTAPTTQTQPTELGNVEMNLAATTTSPTLKAGSNQMAFVLKAGKYEGELVLGTDNNNNVTGKHTLTELAADGKGITGFTFGGEMNSKADWTKMTEKIEITATYTFSNAEGTETPTAGTGALVPVADVAPVFTTGSAVGTISYTVGRGNKALDEIMSITMDYNGTDFNGYKAEANWTDADDDGSLITFKPAYINAYSGLYSDATREATVTYKTAAGTEETATVNVKLR